MRMSSHKQLHIKTIEGGHLQEIQKLFIKATLGSVSYRYHAGYVVATEMTDLYQRTISQMCSVI